MFRVGQQVRISKMKMKFTKPAEHNFSTEIFRIVKVIHRRLRVVYELGDVSGPPKFGQFYQEKLTPARITTRTNYNIDKILDKRVSRGFREYIVRCEITVGTLTRGSLQEVYRICNMTSSNNYYVTLFINASQEIY